MAGEELTHNPSNGVTAGVWRYDDRVLKILTLRPDAPAHWAASTEQRHWNYWAREAAVYDSGLARRLGLATPRAIDITRAGTEFELTLEFVEGRHGSTLTIDDLEAAATVLGRSQGRLDQPDEPWLSRRFLRDYSTTRPADWGLLYDERAWSAPLIERYFDADTRVDLVFMHEQRDRLIDLSESLPRTVCHLDVWPNNLVRRPDGEVVFLDWAFVGDGAIGEDIGNLIPDSVMDLLLPHELLPDLDTRLTAAYLVGLRDAGWTGDDRLVRAGICASAIKYDWLTVLCLAQAGDRELPDYGRRRSVDADARYAARGAALKLLGSWAREALELAAALDL